LLAVFNGIDLRINGWKLEAPGAMVKSLGNRRASILGLIRAVAARGKALKVRWPNPFSQGKMHIPELTDSNAGM